MIFNFSYIQLKCAVHSAVCSCCLLQIIRICGVCVCNGVAAFYCLLSDDAGNGYYKKYGLSSPGRTGSNRSR